MTDRRTANWKPWQLPYRHGTLAIRPPTAVRDRINHWRQKLDPVSYSYADAHITLTQPFQEPVSSNVLSRVVNILATEKPFTIEYGPLRSFLPSPVLWLDVQPADRVLEIRRTLHATGLFDLSLPHTEDFVPHMTITEGLSGPPVDTELLRSLQPQIEGGSFTCSGIMFIKPDKEFRFRVEQEIAFNSA